MMAYGTNDLSMPIVQGPIQVAQALREAGNTDLVLRYYKDADHGLRALTRNCKPSHQTSLTSLTACPHQRA